MNSFVVLFLLIGFFSGLIFGMADQVGYVVFMELAELENENNNLRIENEALKDQLGIKDE